MTVVKVSRYDNIAILFHWLMALLIVVLFGLGWYMVDLPNGSKEKSFYFALHKSIGLTVALLVVLRIIWRLGHTPPALPGILERWQSKLAAVTHFLLYLFIVIQPLSGYLSSSFSGYKTRFWGVPLPHWGWKEQHLNEIFTEIHVASSVVLISLVVLHLCGSLAHLVSSHENVLMRMWPQFSQKSKSDN